MTSYCSQSLDRCLYPKYVTRNLSETHRTDIKSWTFISIRKTLKGSTEVTEDGRVHKGLYPFSEDQSIRMEILF